MTFYAKSETKETIREHTDRLLDNLQLLKDSYGRKFVRMDERMWELLRLAAEYHDVGKANTVFQNKIRRAIRDEMLETDCDADVPHNYLSVGLIPFSQLDLTKEESRLLIHAVGYHHERDKPPDKEMIRHILEADMKKQRNAISEHMQLPLAEKLSFRFVDRLLKRYTIHDGEQFWNYVLLKGLLHRIDHAASAHLPVEIDIDRSVGASVRTYMKKQGFRKNALQQFTEANQDKNVVVIAQTGMGKTEAALLWIGDDKAFFTLPLRVSINAIYERIRDKMGYDAVGLLHSTSVHYLAEKGEENWEAMKQQSQQLSTKLLMTTIDQILKFPFYYRGFEKELATMANAKIVIDEIQAYDPKIAAMLIKALEMIHNVGGKFMIMTATLPTLYLDELKKRNIIDEEHSAFGEFIDTSKHRHRIQLHAKEITEGLEDIVRKAQTSQVLVIVNTVRRAIELYQNLLERELHIPVYLLHSQFTQEDRQLLERKIKEFNDEKINGIWITTQLVEASIDIDFDYLFTEMSTLDSLFQRLGRCYRKRILNEERCNVHIFTKNISGVPRVYNEHLINESIKLLQPYDGHILDERTKVEMVKQLYERKRLIGTAFLQDFEDALYMFDNLDPYGMNKKEAQRKLRDIQNIQVIPRRIYDGIIDLLEMYAACRDVKKRLHLRMEIEKKTVSVSRFIAEKYVSERLPKPFEHIYIIDVEYDFQRETWKGKGILLDTPMSTFY
ncbi:CRISPR-associated helicase Cas3' [Parageobacillus thermoglucosidasius]|uniref:CRISPR-associated helicase Cas3' n=1 Tax=Parageobacillus thermoglucosidasius TaxID=1426 RepID=UPI000B5569A4|nr:CRISPR-associated helicase Cas3' [Parageobacillus thermoglucosidasius]MBY6268485.1 CRISPR-associated helicase/endonuclease Cas3 [Parageobacillus thermoglucosidasius]MED4905603.1 CRISPR-associated helicase Cas3' [Parageobacillus thermoglucosidasius]MED4913989.1 CRISPR-associated helicase Cas3' [Parageobacillus thermoglucosidasius]MED4945776.1 CRISPR-associated helicase Cas3' [Parageobacillus thermoglucosidasius]MED4981295.1 CRISPR-associated helicase Cas3' [Parageobacillus thermoglucosidasiu